MKHMSAMEFVEENLKTIFAYALSRVSNKDDAEDLTNEIVLAILQSADKIKNENSFYAYVWGIAANTYRKFMRKKSRISFDEIDENTSDTSDFTEKIFAQDDVRKLRREIAILTKEYRECTIAYYFDELSCSEVSKKLGISLEMVKYYLFKTRKILKEGISMEREFGEKSFKPVPFEFETIFSGSFNREYRNLFKRKLPGQIMMSAYYTPMTTRELVIELGVASVYLEDEIAMLENYHLISKTNKGKYQTNIVIFTEDFTKEFNVKSARIVEPAISEILSSVGKKLGEIKKLNNISGKLTDNRLLWSLLWPVMRQGNEKFGKEYPQFQNEDMLYDGATGTNYGISGDEYDEEFGCWAFAGYAGIDDNYYASAADFNILPKNNRYFENLDYDSFKEKIYKTVSGEVQPEFLIITEAEEKHLFEILSAEASMMADLYNQLFSCACQIMHSHAPKNVSGQIDRIVFQTLFFRTVGLIGACAVKSSSLIIPDFEGPVAMYICENTKEAKSNINQDVLV